jgi:hypothetical protein
MGFMRLTPENAIATRVAGTRTFVYGGAVIFLMGALGATFAAFGIIGFAWEQPALMIAGASVAGIGLVIPRERPER